MKFRYLKILNFICTYTNLFVKNYKYHVLLNKCERASAYAEQGRRRRFGTIASTRPAAAMANEPHRNHRTDSVPT